MCLLEALPSEVREMIIDKCSPRTLLVLISASPTYLGNFVYGRTRILNKRIDAILRQPSHSPIDVALGIVRLRVQWSRMGQDEFLARGQAFFNTLQDAVEGDMSRRPDRQMLQSLPFLARVAELQDAARVLAPRIKSEVLNMMQTLDSSRAAPNPPAPQMSLDEDLTVERGVLIYELYCRSLTVTDGLAVPEISTFWRPFFMNRIRRRGAGWHDQLFTVYHQVLAEHRRIVREVAQDLHVTVVPAFEQVRAPERAEVRWDAGGWDSQIRRLDRRTANDEYFYCKFLGSLGMGLVNRLAEMTQEARNEYTLVQFSWFNQAHSKTVWRAAPLGLSAFIHLNSWYQNDD
ncbi:hypothetical protein F5Y05DRAFT_81111 [Hypoxylon sp. FL0543]|nr:hypothetical protein F5Y05DRAFT_81111 [Hypoxylon sp. FL0543]